MAEVSIILPVKNSEKYIKNTINSILNQTFEDYELIIIDDFSTDNSLKTINELSNEKFIILKNEKNYGVSFSRNKGILKASGRYIAFIDSDDIWEKEKLEKQLNFMKEKDIAFSFTSYERVKENGEILGKVIAPKEVDFGYLLKSTPIQISTVVIDTQKIDKRIIQMPDLKTCEDIAMYLQILNTGVIAKGLQEGLVKYQVRKHSLSSNKALNTLRRWKIYKKYNLSFAKRCIYIFEHIKNSLIRTIPLGKLKRIKEIINLFSLKQFIEIILFPVILLISFITRPFLKKNIWIIEENPSEACDNGYIFFKYLRENRQDINAFYIIKKKSKDYKKVENLGNVIKHGSLKHWIYYLNAKKIIITQKYANPSMALFYFLHIKGFLKTPRIFLQHGVIKDNCPMFYYCKTKFRLFICGAKREYESIKKDYGYPTENVVYTGLARFDNLNLTGDTNNKLILVAPTWRKWLKNQEEFDNFIKQYYDLINNKDLINCLEKNNIQLQLVLHKNIKKYKVDKHTISKNITINHNEEVDIQDLLNKAELLITDYSSIFMDIAYRKRPIIYYQFDKKEFRQKHLPKGYFSYKNDGFGDVLDDKETVLKKIKYYIENNFKIEEKYSRRMDEFFERKDKNNCKRILEEIEKI